MDLQLAPLEETTQRPQAPAQHERAGKARHSEQRIAGGYESGVRDPNVWRHIGQHMCVDAPPICYRRRFIPRRSIVTTIIDAIKGWLA